MCGIARRLDGDALEIKPGRQFAAACHPRNFELNFVKEVFEKVHVVVA